MQAGGCDGVGGGGNGSGVTGGFNFTLKGRIINFCSTPDANRLYECNLRLKHWGDHDAYVLCRKNGKHDMFVTKIPK